MTSSREISAGIIIYRRTKDGLKFLMLYHGKDYWNFPKGHLEAGEKGIQAALREVSEETGIKSKNLTLEKNFRLTDKYFFIREKKHIFKIVILFLARAENAEVKVSSEHEGYGWFLYKDAVRHIKHKNLHNILREAYAFMKKNKI